MADEDWPDEAWQVDVDETAPRQPAGEPRSTRTLATELVAMAREQFRVVRGTDAQVYAIARTNPGVAVPLRGSRDGLRQQLAAAYFDQRGKAATAVALADMLNVVEGDALRSDAVPVDLRVAARDGALYIDRATPTASAIRVTPSGWDVTGAPPVVFRRTALSAPLPEPERGGTLVPFRDLLNVDDAGFRLLIGWLLAAYMPGIPHPILALLGQQGTAKTTALRLLLALLDPSTAPVRTPPTEPAAWAVTAAHSWAVGLDNVSTLPAWLQDALCKAVTGDGIVRRALYSDNDVSVLAFRRVLALTSIDPGSLQGDVADRMLTVELDPIRKEQRRTDRAVVERFDEVWPLTLGAVLDLLSDVLGVLPGVHLAEHPRMADFARVLAALDVVTGWSTLSDYLRAREETAYSVIEGDAFVSAVLELAEREVIWTGSAGELLAAITPERPPRGWPATPQKAGGLLKRCVPALALAGIQVSERPRQHGGRRGYVITAMTTTDDSPRNLGQAVAARNEPGRPEVPEPGPTTAGGPANNHRRTR